MKQHPSYVNIHIRIDSEHVLQSPIKIIMKFYFILSWNDVITSTLKLGKINQTQGHFTLKLEGM